MWKYKVMIVLFLHVKEGKCHRQIGHHVESLCSICERTNSIEGTSKQRQSVVR